MPTAFLLAASTLSPLAYSIEPSTFQMKEFSIIPTLGLDFKTKRGFSETNGTGSAIQNTRHQVEWQHDWLTNLSSSVGINYDTDKFSDSTRADDAYSLTLGLDYAFLRWLDVSLALSIREKDSDESNFDYEQNIISIGFEVSL